MRLATLIAIFLTLAPVHASRAQTIPPKGTPTTFDVATWNTEWFGSSSNGPSDDALQFANVEATIAQSDIDLWAVEEIADVNDFSQLLSDLGPGFDGTLATNSGTQRIGFIYKRDVVHVRSVKHILEQFDFATRPPLELEADITVGDTTLTVTFIVVHMKAFNDISSYDRRVDGSQRIKNHIDFTTLANSRVMVMGDFNDELLDSITPGQPSPYDNFLQDTDDYFFPTLSLEQAGIKTWIPGSGSNIDQILITNDLVPNYVINSVNTYIELQSLFLPYTTTTSDHLPVYARFDFARSTATEGGIELPTQPLLQTGYPNPFRTTTKIKYKLPGTVDAQLVVYNMLGRKVATLFEGTQTAGTHEAVFDASALPPGVFLIHLRTPSGEKTSVALHVR